MIAGENIESQNSPIENFDASLETKKIDSTESNINSSNPSDTSSSFNSFTSPNTSTSSSPTNNDLNKQQQNNQNFYDPSMGFYTPNYGYYPTQPMYGYENIPVNNLGYPIINPYYDYQQQMFWYSNYPTYFPPGSYPQNWNYNPKTYNPERKKFNKNFNNNNNNNSNNIQNQNSDNNQQRRYKKPFNRRGDNQKLEEVKPVIVPDYDLMKSEQVYVDAYPALPTSNNKNDEKSEEIKPDVELNVEKEVKKEKEISGNAWTAKKWSDIVHGNKIFQNEPLLNDASAQNKVDSQESIAQKLNGLCINDELVPTGQPIKC
ncbi:unnamed protein product [Brachionus calyciflorus]|uniref:Uncharacterized protein n=1 Tax=Brachionus calyciflorus TaxID=104777 RepID=A0A813M2J6_9BILA|nr:unnamed protein product [Brachionus calyciflorus]